MKFDEAAIILKGIPYIQFNDAKILYDFVRNGRFQNILELGFAHGASTCYMAAALDEIGSGLITTIDNQSAKLRRPDIYTLLERTKLSQYVKPIFADSSYTWELMKIVEKQTSRGKCNKIFDFCFIDGAHLWEVDGLSFFLVEKLLKSGGFILFDDLYWTYASSPEDKDTEFVKKMPLEQKNTPQIEKVFNLLVCQHHNFENFRVHNQWGWAQKKQEEDTKAITYSVDNIYREQDIKYSVLTVLRDIMILVHKIRRRVITSIITKTK